jgi:hypothetical protein
MEKKKYQQLETCCVSSPCFWHPAAATAAAIAVVVVVAVVAVVAVIEKLKH